MGKIVKFCSSCDESFTEKFGFCPNCANPLEAFELNPVETAETGVDESPLTIDDSPTVQRASAPEIEEVPVLEIPEADEPETDTVRAGGAAASVFPEYTYAAEPQTIEVANADFIEDVNDEPAVEEAEVETVWAAPRREEATADTADVGNGFHNYEPSAYSEDDGNYYVTVIQEKNVGQRNLLLLGSSVLILSIAVGATIVSLFQKDLGIGAIGDERSLALLLDDVPMPIEEEPKKDKDKGGGGGGGGKEDPEPVNKGDLPDQSPNPTRPPDPKVPRMENPSLMLPPPQTEGTRKTEKIYDRWGDPNSRFGNLSSGPGTGGGMGTGAGTGAGSGRGTGMGSGTGSGSGSGFGDGDGDGTGRGGSGGPPPRVAGVTSPVKILSKPQAKYNDAGRTNGVQGSVRLKVTLLANGSVGSITPVTRLPHGLTEQAIAAARQIRFEPAKQNGIPVSRTVTIDYTFSIY